MEPPPHTHTHHTHSWWRRGVTWPDGALKVLSLTLYSALTSQGPPDCTWDHPIISSLSPRDFYECWWLFWDPTVSLSLSADALLITLFFFLSLRTFCEHWKPNRVLLIKIYWAHVMCLSGVLHLSRAIVLLSLELHLRESKKKFSCTRLWWTEQLTTLRAVDRLLRGQDWILLWVSAMLAWVQLSFGNSQCS